MADHQKTDPNLIQLRLQCLSFALSNKEIASANEPAIATVGRAATFEAYVLNGAAAFEPVVSALNVNAKE